MIGTEIVDDDAEVQIVLDLVERIHTIAEGHSIMQVSAAMGKALQLATEGDAETASAALMTVILNARLSPDMLGDFEIRDASTVH